ncbi:MAG: hypothetical protein WBB82_01530 [Limnothrix sp.]
MKRLIILGLASVMSLGFLGACGGDTTTIEEAPDETTEVEVEEGEEVEMETDMETDGEGEMEVETETEPEGE